MRTTNKQFLDTQESNNQIKTINKEIAFDPNYFAKHNT